MDAFAVMISIFVVVCCFDLLIAAMCFQKQNGKGTSLGLASLGSFVVTACYTASLFAEDYFVFSTLNSLYFAGIDCILIALLFFTSFFIRRSSEKLMTPTNRFLTVIAVMDVFILLLNPFWEIAISYVPSYSVLVPYTYEMHALYWVHLVYTYCLVALILYRLLYALFHVTYIYRTKYLYCILTVVVVVIWNAFFLFRQDPFGVEDVDASLIGYSVAAFLFYWNCFNYTTHGLLTHFHSWIFENVDQGIVLFDDEDRMILYNKKAEMILPEGSLQEDKKIQNFLSDCGLSRGSETSGDHYTFQCFIEGNPMRCEYSVQTDKKQRRLGRLFVFSTISTQYDLLTGFRTWSGFKENAADLFPSAGAAQMVVVCDINNLSDINQQYGRDTGDQAIQHLARVMREAFPKNTIFTRSRDAAIAAVCEDGDIGTIESCISCVQEQMQNDRFFDFPVYLQYAISARGDEDIVNVIRRSLAAMRTKKLMDKTSVHSEMLRSLLQALEQCDSDTGAHVQRTQKSGAELGKRIGLTDQEQSHLALLAIMHDIGKIGIPLEILNKPGKLTDAEWNMMKTHVEKGYNIARSSQELSEIAEMIRYHHERWDGRGYPDGLKGEQIPILSRIISVVDAYDAMTNDRSYRKALRKSEARAELKRCAGSQFDPHVVSEFLVILEEEDKALGIPVEELQAEPVPFVPAPIAVTSSLEKVHKNVHQMFFSKYILDHESRIAQVDDHFITLTGYSREDVEQNQMRQRDLIHEEDWAEYLAKVTMLQPSGPDIYLEHRLRRKDGSEIFVYCYGRSFYDSAEGEERTQIVIINSDDPFGET